MSNSKRRYRKNSERRIYVRGERHDPPDTHLLARALLDMATEMANTKSSASPVSTTEATATNELRQQEPQP